MLLFQFGGAAYIAHEGLDSNEEMQSSIGSADSGRVDNPESEGDIESQDVSINSDGTSEYHEEVMILSLTKLVDDLSFVVFYNTLSFSLGCQL